MTGFSLPSSSVRPAVACAVLAVALAGAQAQVARAALTVSAHPQTVRPGHDVTVRASLATRCRLLVKRSETGPVTQRTSFSGGTGIVHVLPSAAIGPRLVHVTCGRQHGRTRFRVDDGYEPSPEQGNSGPALDSTGTLGGSNFVNARLANLALREIGEHAGPCRQAVIDWARRVSGGSVRLGGSYLSDLRANGGAQVAGNAARKGDVIQLYDPQDPDAYRYGMHTAVVVAHVPGSEVFDVVDSNFDGRETVEHHFWNPYATARRYQLRVSIWRLGTVGGRHQAPVVTPTSGVTNVPAQLFRVQSGCGTACGVIVRAWPATRFRQIGVLYDGQLAPVVCQTVGEALTAANGVVSTVWDGLRSGGYISDLYLSTPGIGVFSPTIPRCGTTPAAPSAPPPSPSPATTRAETSGGLVHTWTSYVDAGGTEGPWIPAYTTIQIACKVQGFQVADGNSWWYRIASSPWSGVFYASADGFYNDGERSGSLVGTPFVDAAVPDC